MKFHVVLSHGDSPERPARITLAEGDELDRLRHVSSTDDPDEFCALLRLLLDGGQAEHPRIEHEWGREMRRLHEILAAARHCAGDERQAAPLGRRARQ